MDTKKTLTNTDALIQFVNGQDVHMSPFGDNRAGERAYAKLERIVSAAYVLTSHVPAEESLRKEVRKVSVTLLSEMLGMRDEMRVSYSEKVKSFEVSVRYLISLVRLLAVSSFVSFQNADVLTEALDEIVHFLHSSQKTSFAESVRLSKESLSDVRVPTEKRTAVVTAPTVRSIPRPEPAREKPIEPAAVTDDVSSAAAVSSSMRAEQIVSVLRAQGRQGIRDIALQLPEYSEKMVQRELADLVNQGRIKKEGEKRWSTYSLAK